MNWVDLFAVARILAYAAMATYALVQHRWWVWCVFTSLVLSTYVYRFTGFSDIIVEIIRTAVAAGLIYITVRRI
jgi:hypothetical protein